MIKKLRNKINEIERTDKKFNGYNNVVIYSNKFGMQVYFKYGRYTYYFRSCFYNSEENGIYRISNHTTIEITFNTFYKNFIKCIKNGASKMEIGYNDMFKLLYW